METLMRDCLVQTEAYILFITLESIVYEYFTKKSIPLGLDISQDIGKTEILGLSDCIQEEGTTCILHCVDSH